MPERSRVPWPRSEAPPWSGPAPARAIAEYEKRRADYDARVKQYEKDMEQYRQRTKQLEELNFRRSEQSPGGG